MGAGRLFCLQGGLFESFLTKKCGGEIFLCQVSRSQGSCRSLCMACRSATWVGRHPSPGPSRGSSCEHSVLHNDGHTFLLYATAKAVEPSRTIGGASRAKRRRRDLSNLFSSLKKIVSSGVGVGMCMKCHPHRIVLTPFAYD